MTNVKVEIKGNQYNTICPICKTPNTLTHIPQKIFVIQLNKVCVHYKELRLNESAIRFEEVK